MTTLIIGGLAALASCLIAFLAGHDIGYHKGFAAGEFTPVPALPKRKPKATKGKSKRAR